MARELSFLETTALWMKHGCKDPAFHPMRYVTTKLALRYGVDVPLETPAEKIPSEMYDDLYYLPSIRSYVTTNQ